MNIVVDNYKVNIRTGGYDVNKNKKPIYSKSIWYCMANANKIPIKQRN